MRFITVRAFDFFVVGSFCPSIVFSPLLYIMEDYYITNEDKGQYVNIYIGAGGRLSIMTKA